MTVNDRDRATERIAVTGGTGFLGQAVVAALADADHTVTSVARSTARALDRPGVTQVVGSILDAEALARAVEGADVVYHLAGLVSRDPRDAEAMRRLHVDGTRQVLEAARAAGARRVVLASTSGTVGCARTPDVVAGDDAPYCDAAITGWPYYETKIAAERAAWELAEAHDLPMISLNPSLILGPGDTRGSSTGDIARFLRGQVPSVPPGGLSLVDVRDLAPVFVAARSAGEVGTRYVLGAANLTIAELFHRLERLSGVRGPRLRLPNAVARAGASVLERGARLLGRTPPVDRASVEMAERYWYIDSARARRDLGFAPRPVDETLADTIADLRARDIVSA